jgi:protein tyrosine/serine phosphatase
MTTALDPSSSSPPTATSSSRAKWRTFAAFLAILLVMTAGAYFWANRTYHFAVVDPGVLYRDGNRGISEFATAIRKSQSKTVVSLIDDEELNDPKKPQFKAEAEWCAQHDVHQERIPVKLGGWPSAADINRFLAIVAVPTNQPVLVHCAQGVRRTGMFVAAYEMSVQNFDKNKATAAIQTFGHSDRTADDVRTFITAYDPATHALAPLPSSTSSE